MRSVCISLANFTKAMRFTEGMVILSYFLNSMGPMGPIVSHFVTGWSRTWEPLEVKVTVCKAVLEDIPYMHIPDDLKHVWWRWDAPSDAP